MSEALQVNLNAANVHIVSTPKAIEKYSAIKVEINSRDIETKSGDDMQYLYENGPKDHWTPETVAKYNIKIRAS